MTFQEEIRQVEEKLRRDFGGSLEKASQQEEELQNGFLDSIYESLEEEEGKVLAQSPSQM